MALGQALGLLRQRQHQRGLLPGLDLKLDHLGKTMTFR